MFGRRNDRLGIDAAELNRDRRVGRVAFDLDFPDLTRPVLHLLQHQPGLFPRDRRADRAMVECRQPSRIKRPQRRHARQQRRQQQRLDQPIVVHEIHPRRVLKRPSQQLLTPRPVLRFQHRQQLLTVQPARVVEVHLHVLAERLVALRDGVIQIAHRHDVADFQRRLLIDQDLEHHLQRRAFALQHARRRDQCLHESGAERINQAEGLAVVNVREQRVHHLFAQLGGLVKGGVEFLPSGGALRLEHALVGDHRQVAVLQLDHRESALVVAERVVEVHLLRTGNRVANELAQVTLPRDEARDRDWPVHVLRFDQLHQFLGLVLHKAQICRVARQPQDQLIEKQNHCVVSQGLRVLRDDLQALVEIEIRLVLARRHVVITAEERPDQITHKPAAVGITRRGRHRRVEALRRPARRNAAPAFARGTGFVLVQRIEKRLVLAVLTQGLGIFEQALREIHTRDRRVGVQLPHVIRVLPENPLLHVPAADHVERHEQDFFSLSPRVVLRHDRRQLSDRSRRGVVVQQQMQHRHEVALARAETAVQVARFAR